MPRKKPQVAPWYATAKGSMIAAVASAVVVASLLALPAPVRSQADSCPNAMHRVGPAANLIDCRAYELVSPADKGGMIVQPSESLEAGSQVSSDGNALLYGLAGALDGAEGGPIGHPYVARRGGPAWASASIVPPILPSSNPGLETAGRTQGGSADLSRAVVYTGAALTPDAWEGGSNGYPHYVRDTATGVHRLITPAPVAGSAPYAVNFMGGSADFDQLLIETTAALTPDAVALPTGFFDFKLYKWDDGGLTLESVLPDGTPAVGTAAGSATHLVAGGVNERTTGTISADGDVVYFTSPAAATGRVYRRTGGETVMVNAAENPDEAVPPGAAAYRLATRDGRRVLFTSQQHLVPEDTNSTAAAGNDLYVYDAQADPNSGRHLTLVSTPTTPGAATNVQGVFGIADDASRVYFVAQGQLTSDAPVGTTNKAYLWESADVTDSGDPEIRYLATVGASAVTNSGAYNQTINGSATRRSVSAGGEALMFLSSGQLDPDRDNGGTEQVYLYLRAEDRIRCISCPVGRPASAAAQIRYFVTVLNGGIRGIEPRYMSADGSRVMFESVDALAEGDTNGRRDVYVWADGEARLVSSGRSDFNSFAVEISPSGDDIFFTTTERLVASDTDDARDVYTARVGGGLPDPPRPTPGCLGDACQGAGGSPPGDRSRATESVIGTGDIRPGPVARVRLRGFSAAQISRLRRGAAVRMNARVNRPGIVRVVVRTRVGRAQRVVGRGRARASGAGRVRVPVRLSRQGRRIANARGGARMTFVARFRGAQHTVRASLSRGSQVTRERKAGR